MSLFVIIGKNEPVYETDFSGAGIANAGGGGAGSAPVKVMIICM